VYVVVGLPAIEHTVGVEEIIVTGRPAVEAATGKYVPPTRALPGTPELKLNVCVPLTTVNDC